MIEVFCEFRLQSAHRLENVPAEHKCSRMHGHSYRIIITVAGPIDPKLGWIIDYAEIDYAWRKYVFAVLDHQDINAMFDGETEGHHPPMGNTTSEWMAAWIASEMQDGLPNEITVTSVEVWETDSFGARWRKS